MARRKPYDFYETSQQQVLALTNRVPIIGVVMECCAGSGAIARALSATPGVLRVLTNDLDPDRAGETSFDAAEDWPDVGAIDWVVTNPPFKQAFRILGRAGENAHVGIAMLLRLSFLEPTKEREYFLATHPPDKLIVLPRYSFTGDGKTDSVTCAWMVWFARPHMGAIHIVPRDAK